MSDRDHEHGQECDHELGCDQESVTPVGSEDLVTEREHQFNHERLDCYWLAVGVAKWCARQALPPERKHLRDQMVRAADSVVLNIAEGSGHDPGGVRRNHYRIAMGSAAEVVAVLELADLTDGAARQAELRRVGAMLAKMSRR